MQLDKCTAELEVMLQPLPQVRWCEKVWKVWKVCARQGGEGQGGRRV